MKYQSNRKAVDAAITRGLQRGLDAAGTLYQAGVKQAMSVHGSNRTGPTGSSPPGSAPAVRTGKLRQSVQVDRSKNQGARPRVRIGTNVVYAAIQEFGGTITARKRGLAAPIHPDARRASDQGLGPRSFDGLFLIPREGRAPLLVREAGHGGLDIMYVLPKRVVLPARPAWRPAFKRLVKAMQKAIKVGVAAELGDRGTFRSGPREPGRIG